MRFIFVNLMLIFGSFQASAVINPIDDSALKAKLLKSAVNLMTKRDGEEAVRRCSSVLVGHRYVLTAFHCVINGGSLWRSVPEKDVPRVIEFQVKGQPKYIKVKSVDYPKQLKEIHRWGKKLYYAMSDAEEEAKGKVFAELRPKIILKLGGDVKVISNYSGVYNDEFNAYAGKLVKASSMSQEEQMQLFHQLEKDAEDLLGMRIKEALPLIDALVKSFGFNGSYEDFERYVNQLDIALLELEADAPSNYKPVSIAGVDLREGSDLQGLVAGSGAFGNFGDNKTKVNSESVIHVGKVKIVGRDGNILTMRAAPSRICRGDSGGPLYIEKDGKLKLVGIHSSVNYADDVERRNDSPSCLQDIPTQAMEIVKFPELLSKIR